MERLFKTLDSIEDMALRLDMLKEAILEFNIQEKSKFIGLYIKYENKKISELFATRNKLINSEKYDEAQKIQKQIKRINKYIKDLRELKYERIESVIEDGLVEINTEEVSKPNENLELSRDGILQLDKFCNTEFIKNLELVKENPFNLELLEKMKDDCIQSNRFLKKSARTAKENDDLELLEKIGKLKRVKGLLLHHINNLIVKCNVHNSKLSKCEETYEDVFGKEREFTDEQICFVEAIINDKDVEITNIVNYAIALKEIIKNYSFLENEERIVNAIKTITEFPIEITFQDYLYALIISALKTKRKTYEKEQKLEKRKVDLLIKYLEDQVLYHDNVFIDDATVLNYEVLNYAVSRQVPYYYLKQIVKQHKDAILFEKDGKSLLVSVLEKYIESVKIELRNHRHDYIKKEYYQNFYHLMLFYKEAEISEYVREQIEAISSEFKEYINLSGYKSENKSEALTSFDRLLNPVGVQEYSSFMGEDILRAQENLNSYTYYLVNSKGRAKQDPDYLRDLKIKISEFQEKFYEDYGKYPNDSVVSDILKIPYYDYMNAYYDLSTVTFNNGSLSFSILIDEEGATYFRMNVLDLSSYVSEGDLLNTYLRENMGKSFKNTKEFSTNYSVPSITYQIKIYPNGSIGNLKIFPSITKVDEKCENLDNYRDNVTLKKFVSAYKKLSKSTHVPENTLELEQFFKDYMTNFVKNFCLREDLPIIMKGKKFKDFDTLMKIQSDLGPVFSKMDKGQFLSYFNIFNEELDAIHYVCNEYEDGDYSLKLDSPSSYIDLFNQRLLLKLEKLLSDKANVTNLNEEAGSICLEANKQIGYIQEEDVKKKRKRRK